jgi:hypothetical protein
MNSRGPNVKHKIVEHYLKEINLKRYSFPIMVTLALIAVIAIGSTVLAGDKSCAQNGTTLNASCSEKACAKDCKDKAQCSKDCDANNCKKNGQRADACKTTCPNKAADTAMKCGPCKPGECRQTNCKVTQSK